jgi:hypothetical protein
MLLSVDDPTATLFNVPDAATIDGRRVTITDPDGAAFARATLRAVSEPENVSSSRWISRVNGNRVG